MLLRGKKVFVKDAIIQNIIHSMNHINSSNSIVAKVSSYYGNKVVPLEVCATFGWSILKDPYKKFSVFLRGWIFDEKTNSYKECIPFCKDFNNTKETINLFIDLTNSMESIYREDYEICFL